MWILERITTFPSTFVKIVLLWIFFNLVFSSSYVRKSIERHKLGENKKVRTTITKHNSIVYPSSITMVVVGRNNLTISEPTSIEAFWWKRVGRRQLPDWLGSLSAGYRLALVFRHSCEGDKFLMLVVPFCFLNNPFLTWKFDYDWKWLVVQNPVLSLSFSEIISGSSGGCHVCCLCVSLPG